MKNKNWDILVGVILIVAMWALLVVSSKQEMARIERDKCGAECLERMKAMHAVYIYDM